MIRLNFERWDYAMMGNRVYARIYCRGWLWTPFVRVRRRCRTIGKLEDYEGKE